MSEHAFKIGQLVVTGRREEISEYSTWPIIDYSAMPPMRVS